MEQKLKQSDVVARITQFGNKPPTAIPNCSPYLFYQIKELYEYSTEDGLYPNKVRLIGMYREPLLVSGKDNIKLDLKLCENKPRSEDIIEVLGCLEYNENGIGVVYVTVGIWEKKCGDIDRYVKNLEILRKFALKQCTNHKSRTFVPPNDKCC